MTEPLTRNRVDIKAILADPLLRKELIEGATDFICKVEGIRREGDLEVTEPLSPAAQAVHDAYCKEDPYYYERSGLVAALRAAADQVVPEEYLVRFPNDSAWQDGFTDANERIRYKLLSIAAELEGGND